MVIILVICDQLAIHNRIVLKRDLLLGSLNSVCSHGGIWKWTQILFMSDVSSAITRWNFSAKQKLRRFVLLLSAAAVVRIDHLIA